MPHQSFSCSFPLFHVFPSSINLLLLPPCFGIYRWKDSNNDEFLVEHMPQTTTESSSKKIIVVSMRIILPPNVINPMIPGCTWAWIGGLSRHRPLHHEQVGRLDVPLEQIAMDVYITHHVRSPLPSCSAPFCNHNKPGKTKRNQHRSQANRAGSGGIRDLAISLLC